MLFASDRGVSAFARANAHDIDEFGDADDAVAGISGTGRPDDGLDDPWRIRASAQHNRGQLSMRFGFPVAIGKTVLIAVSVRVPESWNDCEPWQVR